MGSSRISSEATRLHADNPVFGSTLPRMAHTKQSTGLLKRATNHGVEFANLALIIFTNLLGNTAKRSLEARREVIKIKTTTDVGGRVKAAGSLFASISKRRWMVSRTNIGSHPTCKADMEVRGWSL
jgi:hypothetical protein